MTDKAIVVATPLLGLDLVKQHLGVDFLDDDTLIEAYMRTAEKVVLQHCNRNEAPDELVSEFTVAALIVVKDLYDERGSDGEGVPLAAQRILAPHRLMRV